MEFCPLIIKVESRGFLPESASSDNKVSESDDKVEFLQMIK